MTLYDRIKARREELGLSQDELAKKLGYKSRSTINKIELGINDVTQSKIVAFANALETTPSYLMGWNDSPDNYQSPTITEDYITFPVLGEVAAGYDRIVLEEWEGDTIEIPVSYLKGRRSKEFFVLRVKGDSMYPTYQDGDKLLVLKQQTMNYSGQVGVVIYDDELSTLKKVEYRTGEDWMRLVPINPTHPPIYIENERLEHCRILGIPRLLIRDIND